MELKIDGQPCDLGPKACAAPGYDAAKTADPEACRKGRSLTITIPATPRNDAIVTFAGDPHAAGRFNAALHTAELSAEGSVLIGGTVRLLAASASATEGPAGPGTPPAGCSTRWVWSGART